MKFLAVFVVAILTMNVSANTIENRNTIDGINNIHMEVMNKFFPAEFAEFLQHFMEAFHLAFHNAFSGSFEQFFQNITEVFHNFDGFLPVEFKTAFYNVVKTLPEFSELYTPEFFAAFEEFSHAIKNFFMPHQFYQFLNQALMTFPTVTDVVPAEFFANFGKFLGFVPFAKEFFQQAIMVLEYLVPHAAGHA